MIQEKEINFDGVGYGSYFIKGEGGVLAGVWGESWAEGTAMAKAEGVRCIPGRVAGQEWSE